MPERKPRGTTSERGYGPAHRKLRAKYEPIVRSGNAICARCSKPIAADADWDLGHDDHDRTRYSGPEHQDCNRGAPRRHVIVTDTSREW